MRNIKATRATERAGINYVRTLLEAVDQIVQETGSSNDYGEDLYVNLVADQSRTGDLILIQVKSGPSYKRKDGYRIPVGDHLEFWRGCNVPIFGIVFDIDEERAYWINISDHLAGASLDSSIKVEKTTRYELTRSTVKDFVAEAIDFCATWDRASRPLIAEHLDENLHHSPNMIGRQDSYRTVQQALRSSTSSCIVISGIAGTGKTTLARAVAREASDEFSGGVLAIDMHGFAAAGRRGRARDAYRTLLLALGISPVDIPDRDGPQAALYHAHLGALAREGKPVLILLDNVADASQVIDLIPSSSTHRVIITSREKLSHFLEAHHFILSELTPGESVDLIHDTLSKKRTVRTVEPVEEDFLKLADLCGHLPLALKIAVGILAEDAHLAVADLNVELATRRSRLDVLHLGDLAVRAALVTSYARLPHDLREDFAFLATIPSPEFALSSAATVWRTDERAARINIRRLAESLLIEATEAPGRWRMHDLVYAFAEEQLEAMGAEDKSIRTLSLLEMLAERTGNAKWQLQPDSVEVPRGTAFTSVGAAVTWFDQELSTLVELIERGIALGHEGAEHAYVIAMNSVQYLGQSRQAERAVYVCEQAVKAAKLIKDVERQVGALNNLGIALTAANRFLEARQILVKASAIAERRNYPDHEASVLISLSAVQQHLNGPKAAIPTLKRAVALAMKVGEPHAIAAALTNLGMRYREARQYDLAIDSLQRALPLHHASRDNRNTGSGYANLGIVLTAVGRLSEAIEAFKAAANFYDKAHDAHGSAVAHLGLGRALTRSGSISEAKPHLAVALSTARKFEDKRLEGEALVEQANWCKKSGDSTGADHLYMLSATAYEAGGFHPLALLVERVRVEGIDPDLIS
ncbi:tetratricopeptide repeat protein [Sphaerimonospora cavernae]|uniref:Tetratricopeptide repeat protein n=1 Tax=Sphaerimonospora cavernae TaxID=1740611 RepID=A0ABV6U799_9ACTN